MFVITSEHNRDILHYAFYCPDKQEEIFIPYPPPFFFEWGGWRKSLQHHNSVLAKRKEVQNLQMLDKLELYKMVASFKFFKNMSSNNLSRVKKGGKEGENVSVIFGVMYCILYTYLQGQDGTRKSHQICKLCLTRNQIILDYNKGFSNISWEEEARCGFF